MSISPLFEFMMVWLVCVFPFGVYATVAVHTGRLPSKWQGAVVGLFSFSSPVWAGWPVHLLQPTEWWMLLLLAIGWAMCIGILLGVCACDGKLGLVSFASTLVLMGLGSVSYGLLNGAEIPLLVAVGLWHFVMGGLLISWLWSLNEPKVDREPLCDRCGYDMSGLDHGRCPECGHEHDGALKKA
ncbi:MAG: hypothetical protein ACYTF7_08000 [Planctomycetota bacterium]|jgi:hypothetical protein